jgi:thioredoxin reductase (NADPH)
MIVKQPSVLVISFLLMTHTFFSSYLLSTPPSVTQAEGITNIIPVLVIGSGPAGLSGAMYTSRAKLPTIVVVGKLGGQLADVREIENWPGKQKASGKDAINDLLEQAVHFGAQLMYDEVQSVDFSVWPFSIKTISGTQLRPLAVLLATGRRGKRLSVPGVDQFWGKGVGECTICDAPFHKGDVVSVIGGGDTAADRALQLAAYAKKVYMIVKDSELDATGKVQDYLRENKKIEILYNTTLDEISGDQDTVSAMKVRHLKTNTVEQIAVQGVYFAIGYEPNSEIFSKQIDTDSEGFVLVECNSNSTNIAGVFAAGDLVDKKYGKTGVATGSGIKAGLDAIKFLQTVGYTQVAAERMKQQLYVLEPKQRVKVITITTIEQFDELVKTSKVPILVDFYQEGCSVCTSLMPVVEEIAALNKDNLRVFKAERSLVPEIDTRYKIPGVPYFLFFNNGKLKQAGRINQKKLLEQFVKTALEKSRK